MKSIINKYPVLSFLIINYLISWSFLYPSYQIILNNDKITPLAFIGLIGAYGPTIAAIIIQAILDRSKLKTLLKSVLKFKVPWNIYVLVTIFPILVYTIVYGTALNYFDIKSDFNIVAGISSIPIWFLAALPFGPLGEELGWRGFMLPRLLEKFSPVFSSILVGLAWGIWHLASFTFPGAAIPIYFDVTLGSIGLFCLNTIALSFFYTYIHFRSSGSVFLAILLHSFLNAAANIAVNFLIETKDINVQFATYTANMIIIGIIGIILMKFRKN